MTQGKPSVRAHAAGMLLVLLAFVGALSGFATVAHAVDVDPRGTWNALFVCQKGWCAGQQFRRVVTITDWNPASGAFAGTLKSGSMTGTISGMTVTADSTDAGIQEHFVLTISADASTWSGTGTGKSGATGHETMVRSSPPPTTAAATIAPDSTAVATVPAAGGAVSATTIAITFETAATAGPSTVTPAPSATSTAVPPTSAGRSTETTRPAVAVAATTLPSVAAAAKNGGGRTPSNPATEQSTFLGLPTPGQALTLRNVVDAALLSILLMIIVLFPSTLFNHTLEANIDVIRGWLPSWLRAPTEDELRHRAARAKPSLWHSWRGFVVYMFIAGALYSLMQPGWGFNWATLHTLSGFLVGIVVSTMTGVVMTRTYLRRYGRVSGHIEVELTTLAFAVICVVASRLANFTPGYFYGVLALYVPAHKPSTHDSRRMVVRGLELTYTLAIGGWLLFGPLQRFAAAGGFIRQLPQSLAGGMVTGAVQTIVIGLIPLRFLPGHTLKQWNPKIWATSYLGGAFLFSLVLLHPGLVNAKETSVAWTIGLAVFFAVGSVGFWFFFRQRAQRRETAQTHS